MANLSIDTLKNFKFSVDETINAFVLIIIIMLITKIFVDKKWITEEQSVISSVVIVFLDALLLYAGPDAMSRFLAGVQLFSNIGFIVTVVIQKIFPKKTQNNTGSPSAQCIVQAIPDNTILFIKGDERTILSVAYDKKTKEYVCYENLCRLKNVKPVDLFEDAYADVLMKDAYSYRNVFNQLTNNTEPKEEDYVFTPVWVSRIDTDENSGALANFCRQRLLDNKDALEEAGVTENDVSFVITKPVSDVEEKDLSVDRLQYYKENFKSHRFYRTDITKKGGEDQ